MDHALHVKAVSSHVFQRSPRCHVGGVFNFLEFSNPSSVRIDHSTTENIMLARTTLGFVMGYIVTKILFVNEHYKLL